MGVDGLASDLPAVHCQQWEFECLINKSVTNINLVKENISFWSSLNVVGGVSVVAFGVIATLMIALQGDANKHWTRPVGIIATTLVTGVSSALVSFHVPENVDKLIEIAGAMAEAVNEFEVQSENIRAGRNKESTEIAYKKIPNFAIQ